MTGRVQIRNGKRQAPLETLTVVESTWNRQRPLRARKYAVGIQRCRLVSRDERYPPPVEMQVLPSSHLVPMYRVVAAISPRRT